MYEDSMARLFGTTTKRVQPITLQWRGKTIKVTEIRFAHTFTQGTVTRHVFACSDGVDSFEVTLADNDLKFFARALV